MSEGRRSDKQVMGGLNMMGGGFKMMGGFRTILLGLVLLVAEVVGSDNLTGENKHMKLPVSHYVVSESSSVFGQLCFGLR